MSVIVTITFSPCIDKSSSVPGLIEEKKLKCTKPHLDPGGGGINVARALKNLGSEPIAVFPSGGFTGKLFNQLLEDEEIRSVIIPSQNETRENFIIVDDSTGKQYRFGMPGTMLLETEWKKCLAAIEEIGSIDFLVASGSLPPGVPDDVYARLSQIAIQKNARYILDATGMPLKLGLKAGAFLIKPNLGELSALAGTEQLHPDHIGKIADQIFSEGKCQVIVVSLGAGGALVVTNEGIEKINPPKVKSVSTVGAGDSMVAGIVHSLSRGEILRDAVRYGVACGTAATINPGTALCQKEDADRLLKEMT